MRERIITGVVLLLGFTLLWWLSNDFVFRIAVCLLAFPAIAEWQRMSGRALPVAVTGALVASISLVLGLELAIGLVPIWAGLIALGWLAVVWALIQGQLIRRLSVPVRRAEQAFFLLTLTGALVAVGGFPGTDESLRPARILYFLAVVWLADSGAYFAGRAFGKHKLAPAVSPGKTWEGVAGGVMAVLLMAIGVIVYADGLGFEAGWLLAMSLCGALISVVGDLYESALKRQAGVKDSGTLLPGHGGVLDRIDGLLSALPVMMLLQWMALYG